MHTATVRGASIAAGPHERRCASRASFDRVARQDSGLEVALVSASLAGTSGSDSIGSNYHVARAGKQLVGAAGSRRPGNPVRRTALTLPEATLSALVFAWGMYALVSGIFAVVAAVSGAPTGRRWVLALEGAIGIAAAGVTFLQPRLTATILLFLVALWALIGGALLFVAAIRLRKEITGEFWLGLAGVITVAFGVCCSRSQARARWRSSGSSECMPSRSASSGAHCRSGCTPSRSAGTRKSSNCGRRGSASRRPSTIGTTANRRNTGKGRSAAGGGRSANMAVAA